MGRDAGGHGHDAGEQGNLDHGKDGRFSDGGGGSDAAGQARAHVAGEKAVAHALLSHGHLSAAAHKAADAAGKQKWGKPHVTLDRHATAAAKGDHKPSHSASGYPITSHAGKVSVGTHASAGGGGGGGGGMSSGPGRGIGPHKPVKITRQATAERVAMRQGADQKHFPSGGSDAQQIVRTYAANVPQSTSRLRRAARRAV